MPNNLFTKHLHQSNSPKLYTIICISIFTISIKFSASQSQPNPTKCVLNFNKNASFEDSMGKGGTWGGFISNNYSKTYFKEYIYALGIHANQTGKIFLNETEQKTCLITKGDHNSTCGIKNLRSGNGGCSDFSVNDVNRRFESELNNLRDNCRFPSSITEEKRTCASCVRIWKEIIEKRESRTSVPVEDESNICRMTVLVSLTSTRIEDLNWVLKTYNCLEDDQEQYNDEGSEQTREMKNKKFHSDAGRYAIIGAIIGAIILIIIASAMKKQRKLILLPEKSLKLNCIVDEKYNLPKLSVQMIYVATNSLSRSNFIGEGTSGKVYKGMLPNNRKIAVKHIVNDKYADTFLREIKCLSQIRHPNLVDLLGYCENDAEFFLIYELCPKFQTETSQSGFLYKALSWIQRLEIALDSARGLRFLHTYPGKCIVHRDVKPTNILLGKKFEAKLADFGLSKIVDMDCSVISEVKGTFGYLDPEYQSGCHISCSSDVYSFGIVLLQIISGKKVIDMDLNSPMPLHKMAKTLDRCGSSVQFVDPKLEGEYSSEAFSLIFYLALSCTASKQQRPLMDDIVIELEEAINISTKARASTPDTTPDLTPYILSTR